MPRIFVLALGLALGVAVAICIGIAAGDHAAPVPLFTPGPPIPADHPIHKSIRSSTDIKAAHSIVLNTGAFGADVVSVEINGSVHTFVMHQTKRVVQDVSPREGEENDDSYERRPTLSLYKHDKDGRIHGDVYLPPRSYFHFSGSESPTLLVEMESDVADRPGPFWLKWLQLAAILHLVGCAFAVGTAFIWHRGKSRPTTASRLARADATIFGGSLLLFFLIVACMDPRADWNPKHLDIPVVAGLLFIAAAGAGIVFCRVRAAYARTVSISRSAGEGALAATAGFLVLSAGEWLIDPLRWVWELPFKDWKYINVQFDISTYMQPGIIFALMGAVVGVAFWVINRSLLSSVSAAPAPSFDQAVGALQAA